MLTQTTRWKLRNTYVLIVEYIYVLLLSLCVILVNFYYKNGFHFVDFFIKEF